MYIKSHDVTECTVGGRVSVDISMRYPHDSKGFQDDYRDFDGNDDEPDFEDFTIPEKTYDSIEAALKALTTGSFSMGNNPIDNLKGFDLYVYLNNYYDEDNLFEFYANITSDGKIHYDEGAEKWAKKNNLAWFDYEIRIPFKTDLKKDDPRLAKEIQRAAKKLGIHGAVETDFDGDFDILEF